MSRPLLTLGNQFWVEAPQRHTCPCTWPASVMARGYQDQDQGSDYRPSRPARRVESLRGGVSNPGFSAHYAESPVIQTDNHPRSLPRTRPRSQGRSGTLPRSEVSPAEDHILDGLV